MNGYLKSSIMLFVNIFSQNSKQRNHQNKDLEKSKNADYNKEGNIWIKVQIMI